VFYPIPTSVGALTSGFSAPSGFQYSTNGYTPRVVISSNNFGSLIGYVAGTYPSNVQTSSNNTLGTTVPNLNPINSITITCSLVNNYVGNPTNLLDTFPISGVSFGSNINYSPYYEKWISLIAGRYNRMEITFLDQNFGVIQANDNNILISL
jgi:hypothetical protein